MDPSGGYIDYPFIAEFYDHIEPYRNRQDISFYVDMALKSNGPVLELGCGTGRVLIPITRAGKEIVGIDLSPSMLSICRDKLSREPAEAQSKVKLVLGDIRQFSFKKKFGLITIPFRPFQHLLTVEEQLSCLDCIQRHLSPGGVFILDIFNPSLHHLTHDSYLSEYGDEPAFTTPDGRKVLRRYRTVSRDHFNQIHENELIYYVTFPDGREERLVHRFKMRYLFKFEAEHLLARSGFEIDDIFADYDKSPYGSKYPGELIILAKKG